MSQAAYQKTVNIKDSSQSTGFVEAEANTASMDHGGDLLDDTQMALSNAYRSRIYGLRDWSVSLTMELNQGSSTAFNILRDAWINQRSIDVQYLPDGTVGNGFEGTALVESFNLSGDVGGKETVDVTLQADGAISAAS